MASAPAYRQLRPTDAEACAQMHAQAFTPHWPAHDFRGQIASADRIASGASIGTQPICALVVSRFVGDEADLLTFVVDRGKRRNGVASGLLAYHLSALSGAGVSRVFLEVETGNTAARRLYEKFGFVPVGQRGGYYKGAAQPRDALVMRCDL